MKYTDRCRNFKHFLNIFKIINIFYFILHKFKTCKINGWKLDIGQVNLCIVLMMYDICMFMHELKDKIKYVSHILSYI